MIDVDRGRSSAPAPSSPPAPKHDTAIGYPRLRSPRHNSSNTDDLLSPEIARLPPPRTPISVRSRYRDTSSEYYTAAWGSPYERSPSPSSRSARTALSQQIASSDFSDSSPVPDFGLEHLIPSRLGGNFSLPQATQSPLGRLSAQPDEDEDLTPRSRTKRWVQLPRREDSPKAHWWSDESGHESSNRSQQQRASSSTEAQDFQPRPALGHKSREENQTLDQQSFWKTLRKDKADDMSSLFESRWAATPPAEEPSQKDVSSGLKTSRWADTSSPEPAEQAPKSSLQASRWADTPPPQEEPQSQLPPSMQAPQWADKPDEGDKVEQSEGGAERLEGDAEEPSLNEIAGKKDEEVNVDATAAVLDGSRDGEEAAVDISAVDEAAAVDTVVPRADKSAQDDKPHGVNEPAPVPTDTPANEATPAEETALAPVSPTKARSEVPRFRKKVSWRNRNLIVSIPAIDYRALGVQMPLSTEEVQARLRQFEDAGYNLDGFDASAEANSDGASVHVKPIYPDEDEIRLTARTEKTRVNLPDLKKAEEYQKWLIEQKLKALGVDVGGDEPAPASAQAQNMSRQSSGQYPGQTFSPPIPTTSAASMGRPGMTRGHSHTMSMASPISPLNGPMGHMRGHSVYAGPMGFQHGQQQPHQLQMPGMRAFSPPLQQPPMHSPISGMQAFSPAFNRTGSPAQLAALRGELPFARGPGSPLNPQASMPSPQDYSRNVAEDHFRRQHAYSQSMQQQPMSSYFPSPTAYAQPTPALPELPEEDDEDELTEQPEVQPEPQPQTEQESKFGKKAEPASEAPAYVPPQKRAQFNANIEVPTPRGHRHNISEGFERDILEAEQRQDNEKLNMIEVDYESSGRDSNPYGPSSASWRERAAEKDPLGMDISVQETERSHKKTASRFQVPAEAPQQSQGPPPASSFSFNPGASFQPSFTFGAPKPKEAPQQKFTHNRHQSSGSFNVAAPVFKPSGPAAAASVPKSDFNFSAPAFKPGAPAFEPSKPAEKTVVDDLPSIFGKIDIPDIVKPAKKSKAVQIKRPEENRRSIGGSGTEQEDSDGRVMQSEDRFKRQRATADDGDEVPQFAEPTPLPQPASDLILGSQTGEDETSDLLPTVNERNSEPTAAELAVAQIANSEQPVDHSVKPLDSAVPAWKPSSHGHKSSASLSALARPFQPSFAPQVEEALAHRPKESYADISDLEEGEIREEEPPAASSVRSRSLSAEEDSGAAEHDSIPAFPQPPPAPFELASARVNDFTNIEPSFDEIDAVMRQLNEAEDGLQADDDAENSPSISPVPSPGSHPMKGVTYLPEWSRSDAPSPSPRRRSAQYQPPGDSSFTVHERSDSLERPAVKGWPHINRLNKDEEAPVSDWSGGELLSPEQERLEQRSQFFDKRIDDIVGRVVERRLQPLEDSLRSIQSAVTRRPGSQGLLPQQRSSSAVESDADDEDESEEQRQRPISRGRDKRLDQMKAIVLEALRDQSPRRKSQSAYDLQELHTVLADMKMSFARAASSSLELDDIRAVVDEVVSKQGQSQALVPIAMEEPSYSREASELEVRLKETSAALLEEADLRRASEEREVETKRMLRLAEEELELLRESNRDDDSRNVAAEHEREEMRAQLQAAEHTQRTSEEQVKNLEAENEATYATLEEYRMSSHKWRQDIDQATSDREDLENTISDLEQQLEESQEASSGMRRRLEKLHADMASAAGQLVSEKAAWKDHEEDLKARIEMQEVREAAHLKERALLEDELHGLRASVAQAGEAREATDVKERSLLEDELVGLRADAADAVEVRTALEQMRVSNASLDQMVRSLQGDLTEQQALAARYERDFNDAREAGRAEVQRTRMAMEIDIEQASHQVNLVRAELESELSQVRSELENASMEAENAKARHERFVEEEDETRREALRKVNHANSVALDEARQKHEASLQEMQKAHDRSLGHALEDKQRSEYFLNERLNLSDEKLQHFQDKVLLLEDKLDVAKSAASAAVASAQTTRAMPAAVLAQSARAAALPEKISPQALRESILVLQDQLHAREATIEKLQTQVDKEAPAKLKQRDDEITWLRELLSNRGEELTDLVNTLASPTFDRASVRDAAIRIRANLQMEQQEKERINGTGPNLPGQAIASLSSFAAPKAAQFFSKWRANMESSALKNAPRGRGGAMARSNTPSRPSASKPSSSVGVAPSYMHGLMTPPASNLRTTPSPEASNPLPPPQLSRQSSKASTEDSSSKSRQPSAASDEPTTPLFRSQSYDQDAEDHQVQMQDFDDEEGDEDLDVADDAPPAFRTASTNRSLGDELNDLDNGDDDAAMA